MTPVNDFGKEINMGIRINFLGDVHGNFDQLPDLLNGIKTDVLCVGDYGWGFEEPIDLDVPFKTIRGNHDDPMKAKNHPHYLGDYGMTKEGIAYISGAYSIDRFHRVPGVSWWHNEELDEEDWYNIQDMFNEHNPKVVLSHDCPQMICRIMASIAIATNPITESWGYPPNPTKTSTKLQELWDSCGELTKPRIWVFGHWHVPFDQIIRGTRFVCIPTLTVKEIELPDY